MRASLIRQLFTVIFIISPNKSFIWYILSNWSW